MYSFLRYLGGELVGGNSNVEEAEHHFKKRQRVYNFLHVPFCLEKLVSLGLLICLDCFLFLFTEMPIRIFLALLHGMARCLPFRSGDSTALFHATDLLDLVRLVIWAAVISALRWAPDPFAFDTTMWYHAIRNQSIVKLYVICNILEILERLLGHFGNDILNSCVWTATNAAAALNNGVRRPAKPPAACERAPAVSLLRSLREHLLDVLVAMVYVYLHAMVLMFQVVTLNAAINSHSFGLVTLLVSNNFAELKSFVFKKVDHEYLFRITCYDITERFQLFVFLLLVILHNLASEGWTAEWPSVSHQLYTACIVFAVECIVDWLKHSFLAKFNKLSADVYLTYSTVLCGDISESWEQPLPLDRITSVGHRIGFSPLPLACVVCHMITAIVPTLPQSTGTRAIAALVFVNLLLSKLVLGIMLLGYGCRNADRHIVHQSTSPLKPSAHRTPPHTASPDRTAAHGKERARPTAIVQPHPKASASVQAAAVASASARVRSRSDVSAADVVGESPLGTKTQMPPDPAHRDRTSPQKLELWINTQIDLLNTQTSEASTKHAAAEEVGAEGPDCHEAVLTQISSMWEAALVPSNVVEAVTQTTMIALRERRVTRASTSFFLCGCAMLSCPLIAAESSMLCDAARIGCVLIERVFPTTTWRESTMPNCRRGTTVVDVNLRRWFERTLTEVWRTASRPKRLSSGNARSALAALHDVSSHDAAAHNVRTRLFSSADKT